MLTSTERKKAKKAGVEIGRVVDAVTGKNRVVVTHPSISATCRAFGLDSRTEFAAPKAIQKAHEHIKHYLKNHAALTRSPIAGRENGKGRKMKKPRFEIGDRVRESGFRERVGTVAAMRTEPHYKNDPGTVSIQFDGDRGFSIRSLNAKFISKIKEP